MSKIRGSHHFDVTSRWFTGSSEITTISLSWLLGSKLRALYQRKKARDLFDLVVSIQSKRVTCAEISMAFQAHLKATNAAISRAEFEENLYHKIQDPVFHADLTPLLSTDNPSFDLKEGYEFLTSDLIPKLQGEPWKGEPSRQKKRKRYRRE